jgi:hypothetical protein
MDSVKLINVELDGKKIAFHSGTEFQVQIGKDRGAYKTRYRFTGEIFVLTRRHSRGI